MTAPSWFSTFAHWIASVAGRPITFLLAAAIVVLWAASGPIFHYSDTWQLVINTGTTIVTFLMVFLIQHTQNRDTLAIQIKLDELIRAVKDARNDVIDAEHLDDDQLGKLEKSYRTIAKVVQERTRPCPPTQDPTTPDE